jgi:uncharacterized membrane protein YgcG
MIHSKAASHGGSPWRHDPVPPRPAATSAKHVVHAVLLAACLVAAWLFAAPSVALAQDVPELRDSVTDDADVLSADEEAQVADALEQLRDERDVQLFVAFVDTTDTETVTEFTRATAEANSLGGNDALLLVDLGTRADALWVGPSLDAVTDDEIDGILAVAEDFLADGDFAGAMVAAAEALGEATITAPVTVPPATTAPVTPRPDTGEGAENPSGGTSLVPVLAILLIVGGVFLVGRTFIVRRNAAKADAAEHDRLSREANRALLATDEAVRDADQEVGFAEAQWGEAEAAPFREAIAGAREELRAAFAVRQRLDDSEPDTPEQRRQMLQEIVGRTNAANQLLGAQAARLASLRDLERTAPEQLAALPAAIDGLRTRHAAAGATLAHLEAAYAPSAVASVGGNLVEAEKALTTAAAEADRGRALPDARRGDMVVALRRAQGATTSATRLVDAVDHLATMLDDAAARLPQELAAAAADVATARGGVTRAASIPALPPAPGGQGVPTQDTGAALAAAERLLAEARRAAEARPLDPLVALERATAANAAADTIVAGLQAAEVQRQRRLQVAVSAVATARGRVDRAIDYITTRRHGVGREARTRAAEAEARLADAERLAASDPEAAVTVAQRATQLADEAYGIAAREFGAWDAGNGPVAGPYVRPGGGSAGADIAGAIIGGIIGGMLSGGGGRGSGWGGSPWGGAGSSSGGRSGGGGFGLPRGPIGGGRIGGGGFGGGGGGGRVRGGRW